MGILTYSNTVSGIFFRRLNRFVAEVEIEEKTEGENDKKGGSKILQVHVKNTGRLSELLLPQARVTLQKSSNPSRKTPYDLISVYKPGLEWVNIDSLAPNILVRQYLINSGFDVVKPEYTYGNSRFDFYMEKKGEKYLMEVKGCTLKNEEEEGTGLFPDAPTDRGVKHLLELKKAVQEGYHCAVAFVIQMNGISIVRPNEKTHPAFAEALREAEKAGVKVIFYPCRVEADKIELINSCYQQLFSV